MYILEGDATFWCGDQVLNATSGGWVFLPREVPHSFQVGSRGARLLTFTAPGGFAEFVEAAGEPARALDVPPVAAVDPRRLSAIAAQFGIEILGPPPQTTVNPSANDMPVKTENTHP